MQFYSGEIDSDLILRPLAVDLFAGAGGFSLGAFYAGINVAAAVEINKHASLTYRRNLIENGLTKTKFFQTDILDLDPFEFMESLQLKPGDCDILLGGPPCQGFSAHRLNDTGVDDPRNRLILRYFEFVAALRPRFFLVENVPGMLWPRHSSYVDRFYRKSREIGYHVQPPELLNAKDFGVPQNRRRAFLFGTDERRRPDLTWPPTPSHFASTGDDDAKNWLPARSVFSQPVDEGDPNNIHMNHGEELVRVFKNTPPNGGSRKLSGRTLACHSGHSGHSDVYGRIDPNLPGPTMTTACINPSKGRFVHPTEHHGITLRHAARFQTFPDWFIFEGGLMSGGAQVGNAVPVKMAEALLKPIARICALEKDLVVK